MHPGSELGLTQNELEWEKVIEKLALNLYDDDDDGDVYKNFLWILSNFRIFSFLNLLGDSFTFGCNQVTSEGCETINVL